jgi:hypothetical protein
MKTIKSITELLFALLIISTLITACGEENPPPVNEEELITTFILTFTDSVNSANVITATFRDTDGDGGNAPTLFDTIRLEAGKTYFTEITLLDESKTPSENISDEVLEEANDHHFFFHVSGANLTIIYEDFDTNSPPLPIGLSTKWITGATSNGTTQVILKHQPDVKNGNEAPGETDVDLIFTTQIE